MFDSDAEGWQLPMYRLTVVYDEPADPEAFDRRYTDEHIRLVKAVPGLSSLQLSHPRGGTPYLVAELFWPSEDAYKASAATPDRTAATTAHPRQAAAWVARARGQLPRPSGKRRASA